MLTFHSMKISATYAVIWLHFICIYVIKVQVYISPAQISVGSTQCVQLFHTLGSTIWSCALNETLSSTHKLLQHIYVVYPLKWKTQWKNNHKNCTNFIKSITVYKEWYICDFCAPASDGPYYRTAWKHPTLFFWQTFYLGQQCYWQK
jgi:hypothetical protein